ncbi:hypothetical protein CVV68_11280 [Arthrobacter livingstonensis]|uniref:Uncharacterized protein n=2 Tax=Arthrobacter livingstonensis TaxID=670078 RepID=A0A2V5LV09_9MICC|nr:hypothetical protein CVV68_11280 [Arthrobacter livingstonensis]
MGEMVLAPNWFQVIVMLAPVLAVGSVVLYLFLRFIAWTPRHGKSLANLRQHALWTGFIAWAVSSLASASQAGTFPLGQLQVSNNPWAAVPFSSLIGPVAAVLMVHLIGQLSWPAPKSPKRVAVLEFRRVRDFVQPALGWTVLGVFLLSAGVLVWLVFAPGFPASAAGSPMEGSGYGPQNGRVPGWTLATALGTALAVLALGTHGIMRLIAARRSLEGLDSVQNKTLRTIGMNRLLRVSATVASGLAAIAGNYLVQPAPNSDTTAWVNWLVFANVAVLFAMLVWKPPFLDPASGAGAATADTGYNSLFASGPSADPASGDGPAAAHLADSAMAAAIPAAIVGGFVGALLMTWLGWMGPVVVGITLMLLGYAAMEVLLRRNYATPGKPRTRLRKPVPWPLHAALVIAAVGLALALIQAWRTVTLGPGTAEGWNGTGGPHSFILVPIISATAILATGTLAGWQVFRRPALDKAPLLLDRSLRRRALVRITRTVTSGWFAILGAILLEVRYEADANPLAPQPDLAALGAAAIVLAALLLLYPARKFTRADFVPPAVGALPGNIHPGHAGLNK